MRSMYTRDEVADMIKNGEQLFLAGDFSLLQSLPKGNWIGGSIPYFMSEQGGVVSFNLIHVVKIPSFAEEVKICTYEEQELSRIPENYFDSGFSYILIPAFSSAHVSFAENCMQYNNLYSRPLIGWISGFNLNSKENQTGMVINGNTGESSNSKAVVMHVQLPENKKALINTINLFTQGNGDVLTFDETGFRIKNIFVNGEKCNFSKYLAEREIDLTLPMVTDYQGMKVNVSFKNGKDSSGNVELYAPVFPGMEYMIAAPIGDYEDEFNDYLKRFSNKPDFTCNCILNFLYAKLEGKKTGDVTGPMTFGEIAYILLNQTMVYLVIEDK